MRREILRDTEENFHGRIQLLQLTQEGGALDGTQLLRILYQIQKRLSII